MDIGAVVSTIAQNVVPCIASEICYIFSYDNNLKKLEDEVQRLERTQADFQLRVKEAERNGENIFDTVQNWQKEVKDTVAEAKKLIDTEGGCCLGKCSNPSKKFDKMTQEISRVIANGKFDHISYRVPSEVTITPSGRGYEALESRTSTLNDIKEALKDPKMNMIGVHGMSGVGKSTLVKELAWQVKNDGSFDVAVITTITHSPDVNKIQGQIADVLFDRKLEKESEEGRAAELRKRIKQEKSVLIILDDIWSELDLAEVGIPLGEHNCCKLVMTSRDLNVLKEMGSQKEFDLRILPEEDSWVLFQNTAGDIVKELDIKPTAEKVAECCVGLPLLIVTVAKGLRRKDVIAWRYALTQLERSEHRELRNRVYPALKLSYDCLESELKPLFLFNGSFGVEIHNGDLFSYCWGLGFYGNMQTLTEGRDTHFKLIKDLKASSLLLESEPQRITMHDVVRDVAKTIASDFHPTYVVKSYTKVNEWPNVDKLRKYHYIIIPDYYIDELPEMLECPELKLLVLSIIGDVCLKVPDNFFSKMREVRTMDLSQVLLTPSLPTSLQLLTNLRSLSLCRCELGDIRIIVKFTNLEILSLEGSTIEELPKEIGHLTHLRLLNLTNCSQLIIIPANLISSLTCLEELYMGNCSIQWEVEGSNSETSNASLGELRNLHKLTTLEISIADTSVLPSDLKFLAELTRCILLFGDMWKWSLQWCGGSRESLRTLKLTDSWWTKVPLTTFEDLSFAKLKSVTNVLYDLNDEGFPQLKHLHIQDSDELLHIIHSRGLVNPHSAFPNLLTLVLLRLNGMEEICHGPLPTQSFAKLEVIKVKDCSMLKKIFVGEEEVQFPNLETVDIRFMPALKLIWPNQVTTNSFPKLRNITISYCESLDYVFPISVPNVLQQLQYLEISGCGIESIVEESNGCNMKTIVPSSVLFQSFAKLKVIKVIDCDRLKKLFSYSVIRSLSQLHEMEISNCEDMTEIIAKEKQEDEKELPEIVLPELHSLQLQRLPMLQSFYFPLTVNKNNQSIKSIPLALFNQQVVMPKLETLKLYGINSCKIWDDKLRTLLCFQNLIHLEVYDCDSLTSLFPSLVGRALVKLQHLEICNCSMLKEIFVGEEEVQFPNLETLDIRFTPALKLIWQNQVTPNSFSKLRNITIFACESLDYVFPISVPNVLRQLQYLEISSCGIESIVEESNGCDTTILYLEKLFVLYCPNMKTIVPSYVLFQSLDELDVWNCDGLVNIITPSTTTCLPKLRVLTIRGCDWLEEIYGSRNEGDAQVLGEIDFMKLEHLKLIRLPRLGSFCQGSYDFNFRSLQMVQLDTCPMMETFCHGNLTTPSLTKVQYKGDHWNGDLNTTITTIFTQNNSHQEMSSSSESEEESQELEEEGQEDEEQEKEEEEEEENE